MRSLGFQIFEHTVPPYCIGEASWVAFFVAAGASGRRSLSYTTIVFPVQHTAWRYDSLRAIIDIPI